MKSRFLAALTVALAFLMTGCVVNPQSGYDYGRHEARNTMAVRIGTLEGVRAVRMEGTQSGAGLVAGAALGGVAGSTMGKGRGKTVMTILGVLAGAGAGSAIEEGATSTNGLELLIRLDGGQLIAVVQQSSGEYFAVGQRVRVMTNGARSRVAPM